MTNGASLLAAGISVATSTAFAEPSQPKSTTTAVLLTAAGAAVPSVVLATAVYGEDTSRTSFEPLFVAGALGLAALPAAGHWYARELGAVGLGIRAAGAAGMVAGFHVFATDGDDRNAILLLGGGATLAVGGIAYDLINCRSSVRAWNTQIAVVHIRGGYGLGLAGAF